MIYKFRSMRVDSEKDGARLAMKNDSRVTPIGNILRKLHLDELPQILNILKGEMSVVGPRPERKEIADQYAKEIEEKCVNNDVKHKICFKDIESLEADGEYVPTGANPENMAIMLFTSGTTSTSKAVMLPASLGLGPRT